MTQVSRLTAALAAVLVGACTTAPLSRPGTSAITVSSGTVIDNVTIVSTRDGSLSRGRAIAIEGGKIVKIAAAGSITASGEARRIDASGKYVVPGFLDMHFHALEAADRPTTYWPLMVANGITGYREMSGSVALLERGRQLNREIAQGRAVAPEVLIQTGRLLALTPDGSLPGITTAERAIAEVRRQKQLGSDFVKIITVNRETFFATAQEARTQGLPLVGHLTPVVSATEASNAGMKAMEHLGGGLISVALDCSTDEAAIRQQVMARASAPRPAPPAPPTPAQIQRALVNPLLQSLADADLARRVLDSYSADRCRELARTFVRNGTWQVPTLIRTRTMAFGAEPAYAADPNLQYADPASRALWQDVANQFAKTVPEQVAATYRRFYELQMRIVKLFKEEGVSMLAGPDGGQWAVPGFALHREFDELARAGLSPLDVLQMTTLDGARFLGREAHLGTVEEGKNADLVLLEANPVESTANLHRIGAVFLKGRYLDRVALDKLKAGVAAAYR